MIMKKKLFILFLKRFKKEVVYNIQLKIKILHNHD